MADLQDVFLSYSVDRLRQSTDRIDSCLDRLTADQIWWRGADTQNAVGNLILHLCGNVQQFVLSRIGGAADTRQRDEEFATSGDIDATELKARLRQVVDAAIEVIQGLSESRLLEQVSVMNSDMTVAELVYRIVLHFGEHTGQIVYATKLLTQQELGFTVPLAKRPAMHA